MGDACNKEYLHLKHTWSYSCAKDTKPQPWGVWAGSGMRTWEASGWWHANWCQGYGWVVEGEAKWWTCSGNHKLDTQYCYFNVTGCRFHLSPPSINSTGCKTHWMNDFSSKHSPQLFAVVWWVWSCQIWPAKSLEAPNEAFRDASNGGKCIEYRSSFCLEG